MINYKAQMWGVGGPLVTGCLWRVLEIIGSRIFGGETQGWTEGQSVITMYKKVLYRGKMEGPLKDCVFAFPRFHTEGRAVSSCVCPCHESISGTKSYAYSPTHSYPRHYLGEIC